RNLRLRIEMQANVLNRGKSRIRNGRLTWHLFTDMENQFVEMIDVFPLARVSEKAEHNMVAVIKVPELNPGESFTPTVILRIDTTTRDWLMEQKSSSESEETKTRSMYTSMQKYWETENPAIQEISQTIAERSGEDIEYTRHAYDVVRESVKMKTHLDERRGATRAALEKEGDCDEHADLLVALTRAVRIPSRRIVGHFFRNDQEPEPHAWCEVFLQDRGWIPVDPALGRFGVLTERYFSRIREGLVSERPSIQLRATGTESGTTFIEESVKMSKVTPQGH
ncbi:MAG: transglutaminase family protein, partial [Promethearchaeota archaeon]